MSKRNRKGSAQPSKGAEKDAGGSDPVVVQSYPRPLPDSSRKRKSGSESREEGVMLQSYPKPLPKSSRKKK